MALTDLPYTIFADIIARLSPREAVAARRISRSLRAALTRPELCISLLLLHFPRARESRELRTLLQRRNASTQLESVCWAAALAATARRYHHLGTATPRATQTLPVPADDAGAIWRGVTPWDRFLRLDDKTAAFHYGDPKWTCDADAGLLVHPIAGQRWVLRDVEDCSRTWPVPFETEGKLVRRVRLSHGILVFEWCEKGEEEEEEEEAGVHRHFATAYDVKRVCRDRDDFYTLRRYEKHEVDSEDAARENECQVTFRAEWEIHGLGISLRHQDRFFSTHNGTHYAVYIWQTTLSSRAGENEPLEQLTIWDTAGDDGSPRIITRLTNTRLDHWGVRQRGTPSLRGLRLDDRTQNPSASTDSSGHVFFVEEEHRWSAGPHSSASPPRLHHVKTTGIPLDGAGPRWVDECGKVRPDSGSHASQMPFCRRDTRTQDAAADTDAWPGRCPCWRHDDFPYLTVCEVHDAGAGVRFSARHCFMLETLSVHAKPRLRIHGVAAPSPPTTTRRASDHSSTAGSSSSSSSSRAVKVTNGGGRVDEEKARRRRGGHREALDEEDEGNSVAAGSEAGSDESAATATREIQFADEAWAKLLNAGYICGDERWLVGQDSDGAITIMYF